MQTILIVFHLFLAVGLIGLILIQHGKGADMGAAFGSGASGTVFGAKGSGSFLTRLTAGLATLFFITSMVMAYFAAQRDDGVNVLEGLQQSAPAAEVEAAPQRDVPPVPASDSDMPPVAEPAEQAPATPAETTDMSAVPVPETDVNESATQSDATVAPAETTDTSAVPAPETDVDASAAQSDVTAAPAETTQQPAETKQ